MAVQRYNAGLDREWDAFISSAINGTFLHTRRFLSYHKDRFEDVSLMIRDGRGRLVGLLPAARAQSDPQTVISHPGLTYGGMVYGREFYGQSVIGALEDCIQHYRELGLRRFEYKVVPAIYRGIPDEDDVYALFRLGAQIWRTDLCAVIDQHNRQMLSRNRKTGIKRAYAAGLELSTDPTRLSELWEIVSSQLEQRHNVRPVHTLSDILRLFELFPSDISTVMAMKENRVVAGLVLFYTPQVTRAQYSAADEYAREVSALDLVFDHAIAASRKRGAQYFDFGNSNESDGTVLNEGLYRYKRGLGAGSYSQTFYQLTL